jgi:sodium-dependent dicarboxylate transporter 2/3/5
MSKYGLDRRIALNILTKEFFIKNPFRLILGFSLIGAFLSFWISNTATTAMLLPLALGIISIMKTTEIKNMDKFAVFLLLSIAYSSSIGGATTLVGTPTNLIGVGFLEKLGYNIDFVKWFILAFPITFLTYLFFLFYIKQYIKNIKYNKEEVKNLLLDEKRKLPTLNRGEINTLIAFSLAVILWLLPGIFNILGFTEIYQFFKAHLPNSIVAVIAGILLFILPNGEGEGTLSVEDLKKLDWDAILLFGGGLALGNLIIKTGLAEYIGNKIGGLISPKYIFLFVFVLILSMVFLTEVSSNTATVLTFVPILIGVLQKLHMEPFYIIFGVVIAGSFAFMLPIATPPNAIVYGSRLIPIRTMVKVGFIMNIVGALIITVMIILYMKLGI